MSPRGPSSVGRTQATIVIPTWNGLDLLRGALASLEEQAFRDFETVVVDNGSTDGTVEWLRQNRPSVRIVTFSENRGFAAAVNAGIRTAEGEILVLMNNDVEAEPAWLGALVAGLDRHSEVGVCASKMLCWADPARIDSAGDDLGLLAFSIGHGAPDSSAFREARYVFSACAGAAAYRRSVLDDVGLFDERFYAYLEDVDLGARIQMAGWRCLYVPDAVVYHRGSATADRLPSFKLRLLLRNSLFLFFQYMPPATLALWAPVMLAWPFHRVVREGQPLRIAFGALRELFLGFPEVLRVRRRAQRSARISAREFRNRLAKRLLSPGDFSGAQGGLSAT